MPGKKPAAVGGHEGGSRAVVADPDDVVAGDATYLADEVADQLRERLKELARQLADMQASRRRCVLHRSNTFTQSELLFARTQVDVAQKDAQIKALHHQKMEIERKFGVPMSERSSGERLARGLIVHSWIRKVLGGAHS